MSRLIDADDTIRIIKEYKTVDGEPLTERDKRIIEYVCDHIQYLQPTAYDVEAVVRELEEELQYHVRGELHCEEKGYKSGADRHRQKVIAYDTAIAIVKRGGRNE
jgi:hypothetical protein